MFAGKVLFLNGCGDMKHVADVFEQDLLLPRSTILRLAKEAVPDKLSMHKDAVLAINRATTVFISSLAHK